MIKAEELNKSFDGRTVIENLSLQVHKGEKIAIMAPSGCGKTTLFRILAGLEKADGGRVQVEGSVAFLFQEPRLLPQFSVLENVCAVLDGKDKKKRARDALALVGLRGEEHKYPDELSGGMAQRAVLARALATGRSIFLMDEPFKGLDEQAKKELLTLCKELLMEKTVLLITHDLAEAQALCDKTLTFKAGMRLHSDT